MNKQEIHSLFVRDNPEWVRERLDSVVEHFVARIKSELLASESVRAIYAWQTEDFQINLRKKARWVVAVVTTERIVGLLVKARFGNSGVLVPPSVRGPDDLDVVVYPYAKLSGASGRTPITGFGMSREVYLDRPDGSFVKLTGLDRQRSFAVEATFNQVFRPLLDASQA